ncbi:MAG TPA: hypothetical protein VEZ14_03935 [Dehalococcoidia bacterium]|nr:hypothetical protein [Dehalococcoidia bacterium]
MSRILAAFLLIALFAAATACGTGDKARPPATPVPTERAAATQPAASTTPAAAPGPGDSAAVGNIFSTVLGGAFSGGASAPGAQKASDPTLSRFLPDATDLPPGYTPLGQFTYRLPDGITRNGGMDMAATMAMRGDPSSHDPAKVDMLMSMVLEPDDLTALGKALSSIGQLNDQALQKSLADAGGSFAGITIKDVHTLNASGLGQGAAGISMTMDMSAFMSKLGGAAAAAKVSVITMHMYMFGRGSYIGAVIRMGFTPTLSGGVDELGLAKVIDAKLKAGG